MGKIVMAFLGAVVCIGMGVLVMIMTYTDRDTWQTIDRDGVEAVALKPYDFRERKERRRRLGVFYDIHLEFRKPDGTIAYVVHSVRSGDLSRVTARDPMIVKYLPHETKKLRLNGENTPSAWGYLIGAGFIAAGFALLLKNTAR